MDVVMSDVKSRTSGYLYSATWWSFCLYLMWCCNCDKLSPQCICGVTEVDTQLLLRWWTSSGRTRYCYTALCFTWGIISLSKLIDWCLSIARNSQPTGRSEERCCCPAGISSSWSSASGTSQYPEQDQTYTSSGPTSSGWVVELQPVSLSGLGSVC